MYCPRCGDTLAVRLVVDEGAERLVCPACGLILYCNPKVVAATLTECDGRLCLVRRATAPGEGGWALPGGFVEVGESTEETARRETHEETGLEVEITGLCQVRSGGPAVIVVYDARRSGGTLSPGPEAAEVATFGRDELPLTCLAFPDDRPLIAAWGERPASDSRADGRQRGAAPPAVARGESLRRRRTGSHPDR